MRPMTLTLTLSPSLAVRGPSPLQPAARLFLMLDLCGVPGKTLGTSPGKPAGKAPGKW